MVQVWDVQSLQEIGTLSGKSERIQGTNTYIDSIVCFPRSERDIYDLLFSPSIVKELLHGIRSSFARFNLLQKPHPFYIDSLLLYFGS